jgi:hypothetical protein
MRTAGERGRARDARPRGLRPVVGDLALAALAAAVIAWFVMTDAPPPAAAPTAQAAALAAPPAPEPQPVPAAEAPPAEPEQVPDAVAQVPPAPEFQILEGRIQRGQSLANALGTQGVTPVVIHAIATEMAPVFDFRIEFRYEPNPLVSYYLVREGERYVARKWEAERVRRTARIAGVIATSLYDAIRQLGEDPELAGDFAEIFAWDVDFSHSVQQGDEFSILYERVFRMLPGGEPVYEGPGRILAARYSGIDGDHRALYFEQEEGSGGYYRPDGSSVQRQFLRAPLSYRRISSGYTLSRLHPILKVRRPHQGIDYAAPSGTPVWSVANGRVSFVGRQGGFGKLVKVRHPNGYETYYGHLSRFAKGLRVGQTVSQKQLVGYVGSTGLSTGPHLDFRIKHNGQYVNPARISLPAGPPISPQAVDDFLQKRDDLLAKLEPKPLVATNEAL